MLFANVQELLQSVEVNPEENLISSLNSIQSSFKDVEDHADVLSLATGALEGLESTMNALEAHTDLTASDAMIAMSTVAIDNATRIIGFPSMAMEMEKLEDKNASPKSKKKGLVENIKGKIKAAIKAVEDFIAKIIEGIKKFFIKHLSVRGRALKSMKSVVGKLKGMEYKEIQVEAPRSFYSEGSETDILRFNILSNLLEGFDKAAGSIDKASLLEVMKATSYTTFMGSLSKEIIKSANMIPYTFTKGQNFVKGSNQGYVSVSSFTETYGIRIPGDWIITLEGKFPDAYIIESTDLNDSFDKDKPKIASYTHEKLEELSGYSEESLSAVLELSKTLDKTLKGIKGDVKELLSTGDIRDYDKVDESSASSSKGDGKIKDRFSKKYHLNQLTKLLKGFGSNASMCDAKLAKDSLLMVKRSSEAFSK